MSKKSKKEKERKLKPKIRFPEFHDELSCDPLGQLAHRITDRNSNGKEKRVLTNSAEHGIVDQRDFFEREIITTGNLENYLVVQSGDYVYNPRVSASAPVGPISKNQIGTGVMSPLYTVFRFKFLENDFFAHYFKSSHWHEYLRNISNTGARHDRMSISNDDFMAMPVPFPKPSEQRKIAACLSSLDELIAAESRKLEALQAHKKGLMQQLFPQEGETTPRLRFPEFEDAQEWDAYSLDQIALFRRGSFPQPYGLPKWYDDLHGKPFVQVFDVDDNFRLKEKTKRQISELAANQSIFIPTGTVLVTLQGTIGRVAITQYDAYVDRTLLLFQKFLRPLNKVFFAYALHNRFDIEKRKAPGGIIKTITKEVLSSFILKLPEIPEQEKIAAIMCCIDKNITEHVSEVSMLNDHKKGLMQQIIPSLEDTNA